MLFTLALVIGARRVLRGDNGVGLTLLVVLLNCVCLTNYVQIWEINCATFCGGTLGCMVAAYEKSLRFPEGSAFTMVETRGIEPLTS